MAATVSNPIITSLLDTDLYKFTMGQCVLHHFPGAEVEYKFKCRTPGIPIVRYIDEIKEEIKSWCMLSFTKDELTYLKGIRFIKSDYVEFLRNFQSNYEHIQVTGFDPDGQDSFDITIKGPWISTIYAEVPLLAIVNEVYFRNISKGNMLDEAQVRLNNKINYVKENIEDEDFKFIDFGTRRRFSKVMQDHVIRTLKKELTQNFVGTSNVMFAKEYSLTPIGTMAHEFLMATQSMVRISESQKYAFETWAKEYRGDLGIALSDVVGMDAFFRDFDLYFSKLFDGARHDS